MKTKNWKKKKKNDDNQANSPKKQTNNGKIGVDRSEELKNNWRGKRFRKLKTETKLEKKGDVTRRKPWWLGPETKYFNGNGAHSSDVSTHASHNHQLCVTGVGVTSRLTSRRHVTSGAWRHRRPQSITMRLNSVKLSLRAYRKRRNRRAARRAVSGLTCAVGVMVTERK